MPVSAQHDASAKRLTIKIQGRFDFACHHEFRQAFESEIDPGTAFVLDMGAVDYMDSSALGMLLILREKVGGDASRVSIVNCDSEIRKILEIANYQKLFAIS